MIYSEPCTAVLKVRITTDVDAALRNAAQVLGVNASTITRDALAWYLAHPMLKTSENKQ